MSEKKFSAEHEAFLYDLRRKQLLIRICRAGLIILLLAIWQAAADKGLIDAFITSSPLRVIRCIGRLIADGTLFKHLAVTCMETLAGFLLGLTLGIFTAIVLWWFPTVSEIMEPYLVVLNAMPKVALGPVIIIWAGAGYTSITIMTLAISMITTIMGVYSGFQTTEEEKKTLLKTLGANKMQLLTKVVIPSNCENIISCMKINVGLSWVGVIMGEFLVSKAGLGYLIMYGSQVFNLDLVMSGIVIISLVAAGMYAGINALEKFVRKKFEKL